MKLVAKIFKWKKFTRISPKKTLSGVLGSLVFSLFSVAWIRNKFLQKIFRKKIDKNLKMDKKNRQKQTKQIDKNTASETMGGP